MSKPAWAVKPPIVHDDGTWECGDCGQKFPSRDRYLRHSAFGVEQK